jgi:biopolymer transport protein ExbD
VRKDHTVFWNKGSEAPQKVDMTKIRELLTNQLKGNANLATLIKVDRDAQYQVLVDLMDDLNIAIADSRTNAKRFSIVAMDDKDQAMVNAL